MTVPIHNTADDHPTLHQVDVVEVARVVVNGLQVGLRGGTGQEGGRGVAAVQGVQGRDSHARRVAHYNEQADSHGVHLVDVVGVAGPHPYERHARDGGQGEGD